MTRQTQPYLVDAPPPVANDQDAPPPLWMRLTGVFAASAGLWVMIIAVGDLLLRL